MGSEDDARDKDAGSAFGPPVNDFGPPVRDFGGPELGEAGAQWPGDHPEVGWRPADGGAPPVPPPPPQYRAPETTVFPDNPPPSRPAPPPAPEADNATDATVRYSTGTPPPPAPPAGGGSERWWSPTDSGDVPKPPAESRASGSGLSWADDPIAKRLAPSAPAAPPSTGSNGNMRWIVTGVAAALALVIALVVIVVAVGGGDDDEPGDATAAPPPPSTTAAALSCPASREGNVVVGNGKGGTDNGPDAILGFQYAFYVDRSGERVRQFVAPDGRFSSAADIQKAIDESIPQGTTHCLRITETAPDTYDVALTQHNPDGLTTVYPQIVTTVTRDGQTLLTAVLTKGAS